MVASKVWTLRLCKTSSSLEGGPSQNNRARRSDRARSSGRKCRGFIAGGIRSERPLWLFERRRSATSPRSKPFAISFDLGHQVDRGDVGGRLAARRHAFAQRRGFLSFRNGGSGNFGVPPRSLFSFGQYRHRYVATF